MDLENLTNKEIRARKKAGRKLGLTIARNVFLSGLGLFGLTSCDQCTPNPVPEIVSITQIAKYNGPGDLTDLAPGETINHPENTQYTLFVSAIANEVDTNYGSLIVHDNDVNDLNLEEGVVEFTYSDIAPEKDIIDTVTFLAISKSGQYFANKDVFVQGIDANLPTITNYTFDGSAVTDLPAKLAGDYALNVLHNGDSLDVMIEKYNGSSFDVLSDWSASSGTVSLGGGRYRVNIRSTNTAGNDLEQFEVVGAEFSTSGLAPGEYQHHHVTPEEFNLSWTDLESDGLDIRVKTFYDAFEDLNVETGTSVTVPINDVGAYSAVMFVKNPTSGLWIPTDAKPLGYTGLNLDPYTVNGVGSFGGFAGSDYTYPLSIDEINGEKDPNNDLVKFKCIQTLPSYMSLNEDTGLITITNPPSDNVFLQFYSSDQHDDGLNNSDPTNGNTKENLYTVNFQFVE